MTPEQLISQLPTKGWRLELGSAIRHESGCCPVQMFANVNHWADVYEAGRSAGLSSDVVGKIIRAADNKCWSNSEQEIRKLLLQHCGFKAYLFVFNSSRAITGVVLRSMSFIKKFFR